MTMMLNPSAPTLRVKIRGRLVLGALLLLTLAGCDGQSGNSEPDIAPTTSQAIEERTVASRAAVKAFASELQGELKAAMSAGGPVSAISVCKEAAPAIARDISEQTGWQVGRTSHRLRNPANKPDAHEAGILARFLEARENGADPATLETYDVVMLANGRTAYRYMKAIPAQAACLACHGANLAPEIEASLALSYPDDQATGFREGDIRGAFTITQIID